MPQHIEKTKPTCNKVRLYRYIRPWGASERKLGKSHTIYICLVQKSPQTSWAIFILRWEDQLAVLCAKANKLFMRTVQQNACAPHSEQSASHIVTDPEVIRPSMHSCHDVFFGPESYGQKGEGKKVHG
jgi:hypothetical protein